MKKLIPYLLIPFLAACFEDKGNYSYREVADLTITGIPEIIEVMANAERVVVRPTVTSSTGEVIAADDPNFSFLYLTGRLDTLARTMEIDTAANFRTGVYNCWFVATDNRTGLAASATFTLSVSSTIYEGYMVLCNEGSDERARLDMVSRISASNIVVAHDLMSALGLPNVHHATRIGYHMEAYSGFSEAQIYLLTREGGYSLHENTFLTSELREIKNVMFLATLPEDEHIISYYPLFNAGVSGNARAIFAVSDAGNVYAECPVRYDAAFDSPINTPTLLGNPEYRVAPFVGFSMANNGTRALFYDIDNKRFVGWSYGSTEAVRKVMTPLADPAGALFSFQTGMELLHMEGTRFSGGLVYALLKDAAGKRVIYGINMSGNGFAQESKYENLNAPDLDQATAYAFHSQYPYMFYAAGNKVYLHNLGTNTTYPLSTVDLGASEEVTLLKFNFYTWEQFLVDQSAEFLARQFELIVGSYDNAAPDVNGGKLGFYPVDGANNVSKRVEYTGFARIADVRSEEHTSE
ncbi:MAG: hypothetical protein LBK12_06195, partial [Odoribacteraceae bacterium]|nr:hypothetical protein [Odoribacteraceae bacterium]